MGIGYEAIEITQNAAPGYKVSILDDIECDQDYLFYKLEAKIKYTISKSYLKTSTTPDGRKETVLKNDEVVGRFEYDEHHDRFIKLLSTGKHLPGMSWAEC